MNLVEPESTKVCYRCRETKSIYDFAKSGKNPDGHHSYCRPCMQEYGKQRRALKLQAAAETQA